MKRLVLSFVTFLSLVATAQTIESVKGANDPVKLKIVSQQGYPGTAFVYSTIDKGSGTVDHVALYQVIELKELSGDAGTKTYSYDLYSKNGSLLATHSISQSVYQRLISIFKQAGKSFYDGSGGRRHLYSSDINCLVSIEIDRATLALTKVTPSCDDLE